MRLVTRAEQESHWRRSRYRGPEHPVVRAFAQPKLDRIERVLPLRGRTVLDVGCGPGLFSRFLLERGCEVVGVDASPTMLARAEGFRTVEADAAELPFEDGAFELAFAANLLHHVDDPARVVAEMARVASLGVALIEPNRLNPVMFGFSLLVPAERGGLRSSRAFLRDLIVGAGLQPTGLWATGMISQNNTPACLLPLLRWFDFDFPFGEYLVAAAEKRPADLD